MIRFTNQQGLDVLAILQSHGSVTGDELAKQTHEQLDHPNHDEELIEFVAAILQKVSARVALPGSLVQSLRDAVLSPKELARSKALSNTYQTCMNCNRALDNGELISISDQRPYCTKCVRPSSIACTTCARTVPVDKTLQKQIDKSRRECPACLGKGAPTIDQYNPQLTAERARQILANRAPRPTAPTVATWEAVTTQGGIFINEGAAPPTDLTDLRAQDLITTDEADENF
jgi:hypothetical protein